jgi:hypothetical protein
MWKEVVMAYFQMLSLKLLGGTDEGEENLN